MTQCQGLDRRRWEVADVDGLILQVLPVADSDAEELADLAGGLHADLLGVDAASVAPLTAEAAPEGAKGLGTLAGWLLVQFGTLDGLRAVVAVVRGWASRPGCWTSWSTAGPAARSSSWTAASAARSPTAPRARPTWVCRIASRGKDAGGWY